MFVTMDAVCLWQRVVYLCDNKYCCIFVTVCAFDSGWCIIVTVGAVCLWQWELYICNSGCCMFDTVSVVYL